MFSNFEIKKTIKIIPDKVFLGNYNRFNLVKIIMLKLSVFLYILYILYIPFIQLAFPTDIFLDFLNMIFF